MDTFGYESHAMQRTKLVARKHSSFSLSRCIQRCIGDGNGRIDLGIDHFDAIEMRLYPPRRAISPCRG